MSRKYFVEYKEFDNDGFAHLKDSFYYNQEVYQKFTIRDLKEFINEKRYKMREPICTCFLSIWKDTNDEKNPDKKTISQCLEYNDSTFLDDTIFNEKVKIQVCASFGKKCTCGKLEKLILYCDFEKKIGEMEKRWEEKERKNKENYEKRLKEQKNQYQTEINRLENKIEEQKKEIFVQNEKYKEEIDGLKKELKQNKQKIEEINSKQNNNKKEKEFLSENNHIVLNYIQKNKNLIASEIEIKLKKLIDDNISLEVINKDFISKIVKEEKFKRTLKEYIDDEISNLNDDNINISSLNVIIIGNTGVGKSTLLNKVLKEKLSETKFKYGCTIGIPKVYESKKVKGIRIWDTQGIEYGNYNSETAFKDIEHTIDSLIKENDPDKFINCIWYCFKSHRFTDEEADILKKLYNSFMDKIPIIVVFNKAEYQRETDKMIDYIRNEINKIINIKGFDNKGGNDIKIVKVLAEDYDNDFGTVKSFGIHNLIKQTSESAKIGIERTCTHSLIEQGKEILSKEFNQIIQKLKQKIYGNKNEINEIDDINEIENDQPNNFLNNILNEEKKRKNYLNVNNIDIFDFNNFRKFCKIFSREITKNLLFKEIISDETISIIDKVIEIESEKIRQFFEQIFQNQLEPISNALTEDLINFVSDLEKKNQISNLSSNNNYNELKRQAKNGIIKNLKPVLEDIIYREINQIIFQKFSDKIKEGLLIYYKEISKENKKFREIFTLKGKEISLYCLQKIKNKMDYPKDDFDERNPPNKKYKNYAQLEESDDNNEFEFEYENDNK